MELCTEVDMEVVASLGRMVAEPASSETLGQYPDAFTELATSQDHWGWLLQLMPMEVLAWGLLSP